MNSLRTFERWVEGKPRWLAMILVFVPLYALYFTTNHFPIFKPVAVPILPGEASIPVWGWTSFVYISVFFEIVLAASLLPQKGFGQAVLGAVFILLLHLAIFIIWPTACPRPADGHADWVMGLIRKIDQANNAFPSLHVAISTYIALVLWRTRGRLLGLLFTCWAALIALSTLTTKQHSMLDVLAGLGIALLVTWKGTLAASRNPPQPVLH